jgi:hypothetical protein
LENEKDSLARVVHARGHGGTRACESHAQYLLPVRPLAYCSVLYWDLSCVTASIEWINNLANRADMATCGHTDRNKRRRVALRLAQAGVRQPPEGALEEEQEYCLVC